jgi:predicted XRE-type DNA-binding protein
VEAEGKAALCAPRTPLLRSVPQRFAAQGQAANLRARAELMRQIAAFVNKQGWTQVEAAQHCGVTQPRINDLLRGRVSRFSLDALVNISTALGCRVRVDLEAA